MLAEAKAQLPLISVIIPKLPSVDALHAAITSLKQQTYTVWEAMLVLNSETDSDTRKAALEQARKDSRIHCLDECSGNDFSATLQQAVEQASGKMYCWMEAANHFKPQHLEENLHAIETSLANGHESSGAPLDNGLLAAGVPASVITRLKPVPSETL